jgi:hypothetical protein
MSWSRQVSGRHREKIFSQVSPKRGAIDATGRGAASHILGR